MLSLLSVFVFGIGLTSAKDSLPVVLWHGMGDTCCMPFSMGWVKDQLLAAGVPYVFSIEIGGNQLMDEYHSFFGNTNDFVASVCSTLAQDPKLAGGFNAIGFSQGGQFMRAYVERCNTPKVHNLITWGGQHFGVVDIPGCVSTNFTLCRLMDEVLALGAYTPGVNTFSVQAQYFRSPEDKQGYLARNIFLPDINNELDTKNYTYRNNMLSLNLFVMIMFADDLTVVPRRSSWFEELPWGSMDPSKTIPFNQTEVYLGDWIGTRTLDRLGKVKFLSCPGGHMHITADYLHDQVIVPFLLN